MYTLRIASCLSAVTSCLLAASPVSADDALALPTSFERASAVVREAGLAGELAMAGKEGEVLSAAFGSADKSRQVPNRVGQQWIWASVTKQVTAVLIMQEVDRGRIELDAPVGQYLRAFKGDQVITIRELLQHRSGLPNPSDTPLDGGVPSFYRETGPGIRHASRASGFCSGPAKAARGDKWEYNNCDYLLLGAVLEAVTDQSYASLVRNRIAQPLGLRTLRMAQDGAKRGGAAAVNYESGLPAIDLNVATGGAAAALTGSARDLALLNRALLAGKLLSSKALAVAWDGDPKQGYQALGVWSYSAKLAGCSNPVKLVERRGDFAGTQVRNVIAPESGRAVTFFTNDASADFGEVWQGKGLTYDLLSAAFCSSAISA